jgi:hypothetical protein
VIATSHRQHDIEDAFKKVVPADCMIPIQAIDVGEDIGKFVLARILDDPALERWKDTPKAQDMIEKKLMEKINGR